ncbi:MAG: crotonase [Clostridiales bacterium]|nr:crotonase [Clostridiales bacterium]
MAFKNLLLTKDGNVAILTINRPRALNALNMETLKELDSAIKDLEKDEDIFVIIITGEGKAFVAGADIGEMKVMSVEEAREFAIFGSNIFRRIELMDKAVIAAVNGFALGGGCELAMCCDIILASEKAKFGQPETGLGITPGFAGTQRLSKIVGIKKAKELIFTAGIIGADVADKIGLVNHVVQQDELMPKALEMAKTIASKGQIAVKYAKVAINRGIEINMDSGDAMESELFALCFANEDQKEGMSAFLEKRKADFKNK